MIEETQTRIKNLEIDIETYEKLNPLLAQKFKSKETLEKEL